MTKDVKLTPRAKEFADTGSLTHFFRFTEADLQSIYDYDAANGTYLTVKVGTQNTNQLQEPNKNATI